MLKFNQAQNRRPAQAAISRANQIRRWLSFAAMALVLIVLLLLAFLSGGGMAPSAQSVQAQPSPPVNEGVSQQQGSSQETRMRVKLREEGFDQPLGEADTTIRQNLGLKANEGRVADFVGKNTSTDRWLVAESKGGDLESAVRQLNETANRLWQQDFGANVTNTEFRIYTNANQFSKLQVSAESSPLGGYALQDGYLGYTNEAGQWIFETINGIRIAVMVTL